MALNILATLRQPDLKNTPTTNDLYPELLIQYAVANNFSLESDDYYEEHWNTFWVSYDWGVPWPWKTVKDIAKELNRTGYKREFVFRP